jgi:formate hydrogenlyase subunit 6/NADH:ubiquinone oxidoreductase subunit I
MDIAWLGYPLSFRLMMRCAACTECGRVCNTDTIVVLLNW